MIPNSVMNKTICLFKKQFLFGFPIACLNPHEFLRRLHKINKLVQYHFINKSFCFFASEKERDIIDIRCIHKMDS